MTLYYLHRLSLFQLTSKLHKIKKIFRSGSQEQKLKQTKLFI